MADPKVSIRPSEFVEGGAVPVDKELTWKEARFANFDYTRKDGTVAASTIAARITYVDNDGQEYIQHYSAGDPTRFQPSKDQKTLVAVGNAQALAKSSNYYLLMNALINAGFPEDKLDDDISILDGMKTYNIGMPEPKRSGLQRAEPAEGTTARERIISVPSKIILLPWEKKGARAPAGGTAKTDEVGDGLAKDAIAIVESMLQKADSVTRQQIATTAVRGKKSPVAKYVFTEDFQVTLLANGYSLDGENVTKS